MVRGVRRGAWFDIVGFRRTAKRASLLLASWFLSRAVAVHSGVVGASAPASRCFRFRRKTRLGDPEGTTTADGTVWHTAHTYSCSAAGGFYVVLLGRRGEIKTRHNDNGLTTSLIRPLSFTLCLVFSPRRPTKQHDVESPARASSAGTKSGSSARSLVLLTMLAPVVENRTVEGPARAGDDEISVRLYQISRTKRRQRHAGLQQTTPGRTHK